MRWSRSMLRHSRPRRWCARALWFYALCRFRFVIGLYTMDGGACGVYMCLVSSDRGGPSWLHGRYRPVSRAGDIVDDVESGRLKPSN
jgi:hypothetical protein